MPKIVYVEKHFSASSLALIEQANAIIAEYAAQGFDLTLRQLFYQFVSRDLIANRQAEYKRLGGIVNDARLAGLIDWSAIVDRTRNLQQNAHWRNPRDIVEACAQQFQIDKWAAQRYRPEVWIEKDALIGVISGVCQQNDIPYFSCRGYTSQSEMWAASQRLLRWVQQGQTPVILHLGDHDPSGIDMSRDIAARLKLFVGARIKVLRLALNADQVEQYDPPPNPAKVTDSRAGVYIAQYGPESWELDALEPAVLAALIENHVAQFRNATAWNEALAREQQYRQALGSMAEHWEDLAGTDEEDGE
jgi:hypothetical protein